MIFFLFVNKGAEVSPPIENYCDDLIEQALRETDLEGLEFSAAEWDVFNQYFVGQRCVRCELVNTLYNVGQERAVCHTVISGDKDTRFPDTFTKFMAHLREFKWNFGKSDTTITAIHSETTKSGYDRSHIHVLHGCATYTESHRTCRCAEFARFGLVGTNVKSTYYKQPSKGHLSEVLVYLEKGGRRPYEVYIAGESKRKFPDITDNYFGSCLCGREPHYDNGRIYPDGKNWAGIDLAYEPYQQDTESDGSEQSHVNLGNKGPRLRLQALGEKTSQLILRHFPHNINSVKNLTDFKTQLPELYWNTQLFSKLLPIAWHHSTERWNKLSTLEIIYYRVHSLQSFYNEVNQINYYTIQHSEDILKTLIKSQFNWQTNECIDFVTELRNILDMKLPKINTLVLVSDANAGKTIFFNSLLELFWNCGKLRTPKKDGSEFNFEDGLDRRLNHWPECVIEGVNNINKAKELWGGEPSNVNAKYKSNTVLRRTPLLVDSNRAPWAFVKSNADRVALQARTRHFTWTNQPWLVNIEHYPHPLAWKGIFDNSNSISYWDATRPTSYYEKENIATIANELIMFKDWLNSVYCKPLNEEEILFQYNGT